MKLVSSALTWLALVSGTVKAQQPDFNDYQGDYQEYQDYANYDQGGYGQEDNLYANYADHQAQKAM